MIGKPNSYYDIYRDTEGNIQMDAVPFKTINIGYSETWRKDQGLVKKIIYEQDIDFGIDVWRLDISFYGNIPEAESNLYCYLFISIDGVEKSVRISVRETNVYIVFSNDKELSNVKGIHNVKISFEGKRNTGLSGSATITVTKVDFIKQKKY